MLCRSTLGRRRGGVSGFFPPCTTTHSSDAPPTNIETLDKSKIPFGYYDSNYVHIGLARGWSQLNQVKCGRKRPTQQRQNAGEGEVTRAFWFLRTQCLESSCGSGLVATSLRWACGLRNESGTRNTSGAKAALGPPPPTFTRNTHRKPPKKRKGQNRVKVRSRSRPDFDPTPKTVLLGGETLADPMPRTDPIPDPISTRSQPDFDPIPT